jgi:hypothetical protein
MRNDVIRWGAVSAAIFLILTIVGFCLSLDIDPYQDNVASLLADLDDNEVTWIASSVLLVIGFFFFVMVGVSLVYTHDERDRPYAGAAVLFFALSVVGAILNGVSGIVLSDVASSYFEGSEEAREALLADGELVQSFYIVSQSALFFPIGLALAITGVLMLRGAFFPKAIAWLTLIVAVGGLSGGFLWPILIFGLPIWSLAVGVIMWRRSSESGSMATAPASA